MAYAMGGGWSNNELIYSIHNYMFYTVGVLLGTAHIAFIYL